MDESERKGGERLEEPEGAIVKHDKALADAAQAYQDAKRKADQELVTSLKKVQADVMKTGGATALAEGNAIQAVIDRAPTSGGGSVAAIREHILKGGAFTFAFAGANPSKCKVLPDGKIEGGGPYEQRWRLDGEDLIVSGSVGDERFYRCSDGAFRGIWVKGGGRGEVFTPVEQ